MLPSSSSVLSLTAAGLVVPSWTELSLTPPEGLEDPEPNQPRQVGSRKQTVGEGFCTHVVWLRLNDSRRALLRSQHGPLASAALTTLPTSRATRIDPQPFRLLLCRRLHLPLPLSHRTCRCGRQLDVFGHQRAACSEAGVLGKRGFPLECAAAQVCREAGHECFRARHGPGNVQRSMVGGLRLLRTGSHCGEERN